MKQVRSNFVNTLFRCGWEILRPIAFTTFVLFSIGSISELSFVYAHSRIDQDSSFSEEFAVKRIRRLIKEERFDALSHYIVALDFDAKDISTQQVHLLHHLFETLDKDGDNLYQQIALFEPQLRDYLEKSMNPERFGNQLPINYAYSLYTHFIDSSPGDLISFSKYIFAKAPNKLKLIHLNYLLNFKTQIIYSFAKEIGRLLAENIQHDVRDKNADLLPQIIDSDIFFLLLRKCGSSGQESDAKWLRNLVETLPNMISLLYIESFIRQPHYNMVFYQVLQFLAVNQKTNINNFRNWGADPAFQNNIPTLAGMILHQLSLAFLNYNQSDNTGVLVDKDPMAHFREFLVQKKVLAILSRLPLHNYYVANLVERMSLQSDFVEVREEANELKSKISCYILLENPINLGRLPENP